MQSKRSQPGSKSQTQSSSIKSKSKRKQISKNGKQNTQGRTIARRQVIKTCTLHYWKALADPFQASKTEASACIPDLIDIPSLKRHFTFRGTVTIGTAGLGFVCTNPMINSRDPTFAAATSSLFAGTTCTTALAGVSTYTFGAFPYDNSARPSTRTVACGLRVRYLGTELDRGGRIIPIRFTGINDFLAAGDTVGTILSRPSVSSFPTTRAWHGTTFIPTRQEDYNYSNLDWGGIGVGVNARLAVLLEGKPGNVFEFEHCVHVEIISNAGTTVTSTTSSHSDIVGLSEVRDFFSSLPVSEVGQTLWNRSLDYIKKNAIAIASDNIGTGMKMLL